MAWLLAIAAFSAKIALANGSPMSSKGCSRPNSSSSGNSWSSSGSNSSSLIASLDSVSTVLLSDPEAKEYCSAVYAGSVESWTDPSKLSVFSACCRISATKYVAESGSCEYLV